ncbi:MAG: ATP-dependent Clp protease ATP-binding subunit, partial [Longicatena sp.]
YIRQAIQRGYFEEEVIKIDLRHSVVIMSGEFQLESESTLRFCDKQDILSNVKKALGQDFMEIFDEVLCFKPLQVPEKCSILKKMLGNRCMQFDEADIVSAIHNSKTIDEAARKLRNQIVHS